MTKNKNEQLSTKRDIEELAEMTAKGFVDVEKRIDGRIGSLEKTMKEGFEMVLEEIKGMREESKISRQATRIEYMELSDRVDMLERDMKKVKQKVKA